MRLTDQEINDYKITDIDKKNVEDIQKAMNGEVVRDMISFKDFLATPSAQILIPKVTLGTMREVSEPMYVASRFFNTVRLKSGISMVFPSIGTIARAYDVAEGQEIPEETMDWQAHEGTEIKVGKVGLRLRVTDEMISDSQWDIVNMMIKAAGRAMARHQELKAFTALRNHTHTIIDNSSDNPELHTTGLDANGNLNNTLSAEDLLDILIAVMSNEYNPTNLLMHPLAWTTFARNELTGSLAVNNQAGGVLSSKAYPKGGSFKMGPESIQGRLPFAFTVDLSPFAPLDKTNKTFDLFCLDKDNVGVELRKTDLQMEKFDQPSRDIQNIKFTERFGLGVLNEGRGVVSAKNISMEKSYPEVMRVKSI